MSTLTYALACLGAMSLIICVGGIGFLFFLWVQEQARQWWHAHYPTRFHDDLAGEQRAERDRAARDESVRRARAFAAERAVITDDVDAEWRALNARKEQQS